MLAVRFQKNKVIYWGFWVLITIIFLHDTRYLITKASLPPFLILPVVENAFKHGISKTIQNAYIHIDLAITDELIVKVANNKSNFQKDGETGGIGLANLKKRLILLYPDKHILDITDGPI